jgi:hypothetical protein
MPEGVRSRKNLCRLAGGEDAGGYGITFTVTRRPGSTLRP